MISGENKELPPRRKGASLKPEGAPYLGREYASGSNRIRKLSDGQRNVRDRILAADGPEDYGTVPCLCAVPGEDILVSSIERHGLTCRNVICTACGLIRISPRWNGERYQRFYETEYRDLYNRIDLSKAKFAQTTAGSPWVKGFGAWMREAIEKHGISGGIHALEIGAGAGWNLSHLPPAWTRTGYDVDREYLDIGAELFGVRMKYGLLDEALEDIPTADIIILSHVVEHFMDPVAALASIAGNMKPDALLLIEIPGIFRIHRTALDPMTYLQNAHTFTFCSGTLRSVCQESGLRVLDIDETCRAVCRKSEAAAKSLPDPRLAHATLRYLRLCALGMRAKVPLERVPVAGRYLSALWKRLYFPLLKFAIPPRSARAD